MGSAGARIQRSLSIRQPAPGETTGLHPYGGGAERRRQYRREEEVFNRQLHKERLQQAQEEAARKRVERAKPLTEEEPKRKKDLAHLPPIVAPDPYRETMEALIERWSAFSEPAPGPSGSAPLLTTPSPAEPAPGPSTDIVAASSLTAAGRRTWKS